VTKAWYGKRWVAMKTFPTQKIKSYKQGSNEAAMLQYFANHPHVVPLIDVFENKEDKTLVILEELFNNGSLFDCLYRHRKKLNIIQRLRILVHISEALVYFHNEGYIHRDIKSPNILLDDSFGARVGDLGIMRKFVRTNVNTDTDNNNNNNDNKPNDENADVNNRNLLDAEDEKCEMTHIGTPLWVAPEILDRKPYDTKVDIYSFGVVMYEVIENTLPTTRLRFDSIKPTQNVIAPLLRLCLHSDPKERPTAKQAKYQLRSILRDQCQRILQSRAHANSVGLSGSNGATAGRAIEMIYEEYKRKPVDQNKSQAPNLFKPSVPALKVM